MYFICYSDSTSDFFEAISDEDAMQVRVSELSTILECDPDDIHVFNAEDMNNVI